MMPFLALVTAYFLGAIPFGFLLVKLKTGGDVRTAGSGNIGATNVLRTTGRAAGIATLLLDIAKGYLAVWLAARWTDGDVLWMSAAALAVMAGHAFPIFLKFQGGKAVASFVGAFLCLSPVALLCVLAIFIVIVAWTRHISMGSICAAATFPLAVWLVGRQPLPVFLSALIAAAFIIYRHSNNIQRLHSGTEAKFIFGARE